jgi:hypothetical protein
VKRLIIVFVSASLAIIGSATAALAQYPPSKPPTAPTDPGSGGPVAFTGANISLGMIIVVALVVVGTVLLLATRRRRVVSGK